jgi:membrane protease YdiL (CAAX protease family)
MSDALWGGVAGQLLWALVAVGAAAILPGRSVADRLGLGRGRLGQAKLALALVGFLALSNGVHGATVWLGLLEGTTLAEIDRVVRETGPTHPLLVWLAIGLAPALGEELLFRGFLLRWLATRLAGPAAVLGSAALFGVAHLDAVHGVAAFLLGAYLGAIAWRARSVRAAMLCHAVNNTLALLGTLGRLPELGAAGDPWRAGLALALAAGCLALVLGGRLQPRVPSADPVGGRDEDDSSRTDRR